MRLDEYARQDGLGLAALVAAGEVTPAELAQLAGHAIERVNPQVHAIVETYADRIEALDESTLGSGPFRGVPFVMKDVFGHEAGRRIEFGSRLCRDMVADVDSAYCTLVRQAGINIIGRSAAPEYSMAGTAESLLYGSTCTPWRAGHSAGGSTGGGMAAVVAGMVPIAHGSDIAGSIRIPASYCGGVGLKPSRGRISFGPTIDENGFGMAQNFVQTRTVRDAAALLDILAVPQPGDPFPIPRPGRPWAELAHQDAPRLRIGWSTAATMGFATDPEVSRAVEATAHLLAGMGHHVEQADPDFDGLRVLRSMMDVWFFGFDGRLAGYAQRTGRAIGPDTLEPMILKVHAYAQQMKPVQLMTALAALNTARRRLGAYFTRFDILLTPTTARVSEPWGNYQLARDDLDLDGMAEHILRPTVQFTLPHNILGTPAISLPLAMHGNGLPIGVQLGAAPANEHLLLQLAAVLEVATPWRDRVPPLHVSRVA